MPKVTFDVEPKTFVVAAMNTEFIARLHHTFDSASMADVFPLCSLLPRATLERQNVDELIEDSGLPAETICERLTIMNRYGF
ncbi:hypothetical protein BH20ACI2_BH20ACI2_09750 [soil metagenome]